ncbi:GAF domain-containing sensor histidine kinase [Actinokineospora fastidiosa]|uniref:Histidine kinase n=1 Tax=Actinokineospora fastidiosa TaxID=1816 RepID=A0A918GC90_9PSEU|nr:GAF domain-containing sensor histidine kinase [Actinokineospora fastidiosa]GGS28484.1 histidine kinase [Actinokineospora fastidiosa]
MSEHDIGGDVPTDPLRFPDTARLELDAAIDALVERAHAVRNTQERLRSLLRATHLVASHVDLAVVLRHIVTAARELVDATYAALAVLGPDGEVDEFVHVGMDAEQVARVGHPPRGLGILGLLITEPRPLRLADLTAHPAATGFPAGHPAMRSFLGVPILVRGRAFGNLYLADKAGGGEFTAEDESLVQSLAGYAAVAVDNARLFAEARRREAWQHSSVDITAALLAGQDTDDVLRLIADRARTTAEADVAAVVVPAAESALLVVRTAVGERADDLLGRGLPVNESLCGLAMTDAEPLISADIAEDERAYPPLAVELGPAMVVPLVTPDHPPTGVLLVANRRGRRGFDRGDLDLLAAFGAQAALAQRLAAHRADAQELRLLEERDRIGRDLHDHVIQEVFATGLSLHSVAATAAPEQRRKLMVAVRRLDQVISDIRSTIFDLHSPPAPSEDGPPSLRRRLTRVIHDLTDAIGFTPALRFDGPLDTLVPEAIAVDLVAVVREALSNAARHAAATAVTVEVSASPGRVTARIEDNGRGITDGKRRSGLANLDGRARAHGGAFTVDSSPGQGTALTWTTPLPAE